MDEEAECCRVEDVIASSDISKDDVESYIERRALQMPADRWVERLQDTARFTSQPETAFFEGINSEPNSATGISVYAIHQLIFYSYQGIRQGHDIFSSQSARTETLSDTRSEIEMFDWGRDFEAQELAHLLLESYYITAACASLSYHDPGLQKALTWYLGQRSHATSSLQYGVSLIMAASSGMYQQIGSSTQTYHTVRLADTAATIRNSFPSLSEESLDEKIVSAVRGVMSDLYDGVESNGRQITPQRVSEIYTEKAHRHPHWDRGLPNECSPNFDPRDMCGQIRDGVPENL